MLERVIKKQNALLLGKDRAKCPFYRVKFIVYVMIFIYSPLIIRIHHRLCGLTLNLWHGMRIYLELFLLSYGVTEYFSTGATIIFY